MTVRVNKSSFNIREKLSDLGRKFGLKGSELVAAETVQEARDIVSAGRKNALYNGDMQIWQRGTTFANGGGGAVVNYTADRWNSTRYISSENDVTREDANHLGFRYCLRSARGGGDTATTARFVSQVLEQEDTWKLRGKYVTFSFYLRVGSGFNGGKVFSSITYHSDSSREERFHYDQFQNGNNTRSRIAHRSLSADWKRYTHTTYIPEDVQQIGVAIASDENLPNAVSADYFEMTGCQLEVGRNATEFEHRPYGEEFSLCQRYYQKKIIGYGRVAHFRTDAILVFAADLPVELRAAAGSITQNSGLNNWAYRDGVSPTISALNSNSSASETRLSVLYDVSSGGDSDETCFYYGGGSILIDAEL